MFRFSTFALLLTTLGLAGCDVSSLATRPSESDSTQLDSASPASFNSQKIDLIHANERVFNRHVSSGVVLVKFGADWCGPCRRVTPELEKLAAKNAGYLTVLSVDVDDEKDLSRKYVKRGIPHIVLFRDGKEIESWTGYRSASQLQSAIGTLAPKGEVKSNPFST